MHPIQILDIEKIPLDVTSLILRVAIIATRE